ncbi:lytic polysaccharide monooxygenase [Streptomyces chlorus]|uniref:Lytic polysaccharide monooxygenase n=1 Tax=Streptomyces chlorus TaxID=887452 RepID=A0ABW1DW32_9ACTN
MILPPSIRPYRREDRPALDDICIRTAYSGQDGRPLYRDPSILPAIFASPYVHLEPGLAFALDDGQGRAVGYNSIEMVGAWQTADVDSGFTVRLYDQASHGADYFLVHVTRQGFDPTTQPLTLDDLEPVATTGSYGPSRNYSIPVSTSGYSGHHVVCTIWQASHMDQTYFPCSDVNFG